MKQYNIYAGLSGGFGGARYQYTTLCETEEEACDEAYESACEEYASYKGLHGLLSRSRQTEAYCEQNELQEEDLTEEDFENIEDMFNEERENRIEYYVVLTEEDNIDPEDLILGYVIEYDSSDSTDSK